jgi:peptidoglycan hydrolase-like protein with peptidoglycan-binding domain
MTGTGSSAAQGSMWDSTEVGNIPGNPFAAAGYIDGYYVTYPQLREKFPDAHLLSITVLGNDADCADDEPGDMTDGDIPPWIQRQHTRGLQRPCAYRSASYVDGLAALIGKAGIARSSYRIWSAHYTGQPHICGPSTCRATQIQCDATQWTDTALGRNLDQSLVSGDFFGDSPAPPPSSGWTQKMISNLPTISLTSPYTQDRTSWRPVARIQGLCTALRSPVTIDGVYGPATEAAVKAVQHSFGLAQDGIVGPQTWGCLVAGSPG